jgi:hypothetical protein
MNERVLVAGSNIFGMVRCPEQNEDVRNIPDSILPGGTPFRITKSENVRFLFDGDWKNYVYSQLEWNGGSCWAISTHIDWAMRRS